jgi:hypothetical protein
VLPGVFNCTYKRFPPPFTAPPGKPYVTDVTDSSPHGAYTWVGNVGVGVAPSPQCRVSGAAPVDNAVFVHVVASAFHSQACTRIQRLSFRRLSFKYEACTRVSNTRQRLSPQFQTRSASRLNRFLAFLVQLCDHLGAAGAHGLVSVSEYPQQKRRSKDGSTANRPQTCDNVDVRRRGHTGGPG